MLSVPAHFARFGEHVYDGGVGSCSHWAFVVHVS
jgi:hypothetical protein